MIEPLDGRVIPRRVPSLLECELSEELLLHAPGSSSAHSLNASARAIWGLCDGRRSIDAIADDLTRRFDVPPGESLAAVRDVLRRLVDLGLVRLSDAADPGVAGP
jgi:hypothetical protein